MKIQLALDRLSIVKAIEIANSCKNEVDWLEIGTSLIKEFGTESIRTFRQAFPNKILLADMKIIDNALYESDIAYAAGADIVTVMGCGPVITIELVAQSAKKHNKDYMIDLLGTNKLRQKTIRANFTDAIFCLHVSKDIQEIQEKSFRFEDTLLKEQRLAVAGGINKQNIKSIANEIIPEIFIIGGAITQTDDPQKAANELRYLLNGKG